MGGTAIVNTLTGANNPAGKLDTTWYPADFTTKRSMFDMDLRSGEGITHLWYSGTPLWAFGHGLSYTSFSYKWSEETTDEKTDKTPARIAADALAAAGGVDYEVTVTNTGARAGDCVVLGFVGGTPPGFPRQRLFDFARVHLPAGASTTVLLSSPAEALAVVDAGGRRVLRAGVFEVRVGDLRAPAVRSLEVVPEDGGGEVVLEDLGSVLLGFSPHYPASALPARAQPRRSAAVAAAPPSAPSAYSSRRTICCASGESDCSTRWQV
jgi:hypothetical protein